MHVCFAFWMTSLSRRRAIAVAGGVAAMVAGCAPRARGDDDGAMRFTYGPHPSQYAELTLPAGAAPAPVVVVIHGGTGGRATVPSSAVRWPPTWWAAASRRSTSNTAGWATEVGGRRRGRTSRRRSTPSRAADRTGPRPRCRAWTFGWRATGGVAGRSPRRCGLARGRCASGGCAGPRARFGGRARRRCRRRLPRRLARARRRRRMRRRRPWPCCRWGCRRCACTAPPTPWCRSTSPRALSPRRRRRVTSTTLHTFDGDHFDPITVGTPAWDLCVDGPARADRPLTYIRPSPGDWLGRA